MKKTILIVMVLTLLSKVIGFLRDIILAYFYGASNISDVFLISLVIPSVIFGFIGKGLSSAFIPIYSRIESQYGTKASWNFTNNIVTLIFLFSLLLFLGCLIFTETLVKVFASGFNHETLQLAVSFTRITIVSMYFTGVIYIFIGFLQIRGKHVIPSLIGLPLNMAIIMAIILSSSINLFLLPFGKVIASLLQFLCLIPFIKKEGFRYRPILNIKDNHLKKMIVFSLPIIFSSSVEQINKLVDRTIASNISVGGISALNYADQLNIFIQGIFVTSIAAVFFPIISKIATKGSFDQLKKVLAKTIIIINIFLVPITVASIIFAEPIVQLLFGRGAFSLTAINMTSSALLFYSIGMVAFGLREVLTKVFFSMHDTKTPLINGFVALIMNIILNLILSRYLGIGGLALATSISAIFTTIILFINLWRKIGDFELRNIFVAFVKVVVCSIITGRVLIIIFNLTSSLLSLPLSLLFSVVIGALFYTTSIYLLKIKEFNDLLLGMQSKLGLILKPKNIKQKEHL